MRARPEMVAEVPEADRRRARPIQRKVCVAIRIERRSDLGSCQIVEQAIDQVHRLSIA